MATFKAQCLQVIGLVLLFACAAAAQRTTATYYGTVVDPSGAVIPGASVTMTNQLTGVVSKRSTNASGDFAFNFLTVGQYTITITKSGFKTYTSSGTDLMAGQNVRQSITLQVGSEKQQVTVTGKTPIVNMVTSNQEARLSTLKVTQLPVFARNFVSLAGLTTGSVANPGGGNQSGTFEFNGLGKGTTSITVDGTQASGQDDAPTAEMRGGFNLVPLVSIDAVESIQVTKGVLPAEYDSTLSGNVNIVTKSGTNQWHGSVFEGYQGTALNAFPRGVSNKPSIVLNQFGGSLGGPIMKNKLFAFGAYEGDRESAFTIVSGDVPTTTLVSEAEAAVPAYKLWFDSLPVVPPTNPGDLTEHYQAAGANTARDNWFMIKPDWWISSNQRVAVTYTRDRPSSYEPRVSPVNPRTYSGQSDRVTATYTLLRPGWESETRFGFNRNYTDRLDAWFNVMEPNVTESTFGGARVPNIKVLGLDNGSGELSSGGGTPSWSIGEKVATSIGKHSLKFGGIFIRSASSGLDISSPQLKYSSLADFLANTPDSVQLNYGVSQYGGSATQFGFFAQDDWKVTRKLTINMGLREDYFGHLVVNGPKGGPPHMYNPNGIVNLSDFEIGHFRPANNPYNSDGLNLSPRLGFAYNPDGQGKNVFRMSSGILYSPLVNDVLGSVVMISPGLASRYTLSKLQAEAFGMKFPVYQEDFLSVLQGSNSGASYDIIEPTIHAPYAVEYYADYEREITPTLMFETAYMGSHGVGFEIRRPYNEVNRVTGLYPNPAIGQGNYNDNSDSILYNSWQSSLRKRFSHNLTFDVNYTWSKDLSYAAGDILSDPPHLQDFFNLQNSRGPTNADRTQMFNADYVYELPRFSGFSNPVIRRGLGGWQISGIFTAETGAPIDITEGNSSIFSRPDFIGGQPILPNYASTSIYLNPAAFMDVPISNLSGAAIRPGNIGRNAYRAPGTWDFDFSLAKNIALTEHIHLQLRADAFDVFNHSNLGGPNTNIDKKDFGVITGRSGERQVQLNGRLTF